MTQHWYANWRQRRNPVIVGRDVQIPPRFPALDLADTELPIRVEFTKLHPLRDEHEKLKIDITVGRMDIYLRVIQRKPDRIEEVCLISISRLRIERREDRLPYLLLRAECDCEFSKEIREAIGRYMVSNSWLGKYCRDKHGRGAMEQWKDSQSVEALTSAYSMTRLVTQNRS